jgi:hypothetical protein
MTARRIATACLLKALLGLIQDYPGTEALIENLAKTDRT